MSEEGEEGDEIRRRMQELVASVRNTYPNAPIKWIVLDMQSDHAHLRPEGRFTATEQDAKLLVDDLREFRPTPEDMPDECVKRWFTASFGGQDRESNGAIVERAHEQLMMIEKPDVVLRRCIYCGCHTDRLETKWSHGAVNSTTPVCPRAECRKDYQKSKGP